ncbi:GntR family transcriptional regulator [uncultured Cohaesibacter sp.]|uniref:GntR family transcriptional regulator n=1 Tax=uncultured Cohaesibacter sp. TaxID=1002546 RepID=UPI0029C8FF85|nr:GntR family transcriptional regulator [uncultured Cohaesibacter sp.]
MQAQQEIKKLSDMVYDKLCDALLKGRYLPGKRLKIRELAEEMQTSVTPVRDAILRLHYDEAVIYNSPRSIHVTSLTKARYEEIRKIRLPLEVMSARAAAQYATMSDIGALEALIAENEDVIIKGDGIRGAALNQQFHFKLVEMSAMPVLYGVLRRLWLQTGPLIAHGYLEAGRAMIDHHYEVLDAIRNKDVEAAAIAIERDLTLGGAPLVRMLDKLADGAHPPA